MNRDGHRDVVAFHRSGSHNINVHTFRGSTNGKLARTLSAHLKSWSLFTLKLTSADVNRDGFSDVVAFHKSGTRNINVWTLTGAPRNKLSLKLGVLLKDWNLASLKL